MKKLAIFDFDGTLMDTVNDVVICFNKALTIHDLPTLTREEYIGVI
ncbi:HAD hydrolase-like protein [Methanobrevibacter sp. V74]|nr:HAD hydrolase-like protein [Methanobrevibacter sp. V74]